MSSRATGGASPDYSPKDFLVWQILLKASQGWQPSQFLVAIPDEKKLRTYLTNPRGLNLKPDTEGLFKPVGIDVPRGLSGVIGKFVRAVAAKVPTRTRYTAKIAASVERNGERLSPGRAAGAKTACKQCGDPVATKNIAAHKKTKKCKMAAALKAGLTLLA